MVIHFRHDGAGAHRTIKRCIGRNSIRRGVLLLGIGELRKFRNELEGNIFQGAVTVLCNTYFGCA